MHCKVALNFLSLMLGDEAVVDNTKSMQAYQIYRLQSRFQNYKKEEYVMVIHQENKQAASGSNLLTSQEQAICKQIITREAPHGPRALFLLALNESSSQAQAAEQTGLTVGQAKYWAAKFRKQRLGIFPDTLLNELSEEAEVEPAPEIKKEPELVIEKEASSGDKTKEKKAKKAKKAEKAEKKTRKAKKDKKSKKAKKTKKKKK